MNNANSFEKRDFYYIMKRGCVFSHYNKLNKVSDYVLRYLAELKKHVEVIAFVSTSKLRGSDYNELRKIADIVIERENIGYDFYSYKIGIEKLKEMELDEILICNDSVFGPFYDLGQILDKMSGEDCDFWGLTESFAKGKYHLQSYFLVFKSKALSSDVFWNFWNKLEIINGKMEIIEKYEIGLTQYLIKNNFKPGVFIKTVEVTPKQKMDNFKSLIATFWNRFCLAPWKILKAPYSLLVVSRGLISGDLLKSVNPTHVLWERTIVKHKMPFIKINLLLDNPERINISGWE